MYVETSNPANSVLNFSNIVDFNDPLYRNPYSRKDLGVSATITYSEL